MRTLCGFAVSLVTGTCRSSEAGEFTVDHRSATAPHFQRLMRDHVPTMAMGVQSYMAAAQQAKTRRLAVLPRHVVNV